MPLQSNFPQLFHAADEASERAQNAFFRMSGARLFALCIAGVLAEMTMREAEIAVAVVFGIALALELVVVRRRPERTWYDERAGAESVKTLAWRYSVGGAPFTQDVSDPDALFGQRLQDIFGQSEEPREEMKRARTSSLEARRDLYRRERIEDQFGWYTKNARVNERHARVWSIVLVLVEAGAFVAALLRAMGRIDFDLFGIVGAIGAAAAAWTQTRQYESLAAAYSVAAEELAIIASRVDGVDGEEAWGTFVANAEGAMSREHTMWRASRR
ncbi:MAG TPA: DUF4231 domain-containing protein [Thermoanaerobaculia bacterium]|jgi:hypothetical protein|nr:DUF4231 domain-containing protein [Thermoanaerobaculia bacterium]